MDKLIEVRNLKKWIPIRSKKFSRNAKRYVHAVDGVDLDIYANETLALVGESGCGKSTLGKLLVRLTDPTDGTISFQGQDILALRGEELRKFRKHIQIVFQDIGASLNPRKTVKQIVAQPLHINNKEMDKDKINKTVCDLLREVGLNPPEGYLNRYPHEFSGGQRQRIGIARAIVLSPQFIVADEPVSALDVSIRGQILNLLNDIKRKYKLTFLFITHDLSVVRSVADRVAVMYLGKIVEVAPVEEFFLNTLHPYSKAILSATPIADPEKSKNRQIIELRGELPSPVDLPSGCRFCTRCPNTKPECKENSPELIEVNENHWVACCLFRPETQGKN